MATTTPNYGWTVPTSTDLVKDGATAIETLGDSIDASMFTALGTKKAGMVLLNTTSFSAVSSQSFNDVFSTTYTNYKIIFKLTMATSASINMRLRVSGSDNSTASSYGTNYNYVSLSGGAATGTGYNNTDKWLINQSTNYSSGSGYIDLYDVFTTDLTRATFSHSGTDGGNYYNWTGGANHNQSVSYTGFTIFPSSSTFSGTISVYGFNK